MNKIALVRKRANRLIEWANRNGHDIWVKIGDKFVTVYVVRKYYTTLEIYEIDKFSDLKPVKDFIENA